MTEWLYEAGIGEARAALVADGTIIEALIEPDSDAPRVGAVVTVRLAERSGTRGIVALEGSLEGLIDPLPASLPLGSRFAAQVVREAIPEPGAVKRMKLRAMPLAAPTPGLSLYERLVATGVPVRTLAPHVSDALEVAGWSETLEAARDGEVAFVGGALRLSLTPAMTVIDVDGDLPPFPLALAGAQAAAAAIRRFDITGSIGIDLPTLGGKAERLAVAEAVDALLPQPFERTAVNGFGFLQIVRPRLRPSLCERLQFDAPASAARALLRRVQRSGLVGAVTLTAAPAVTAVFAAHPAWLDTLGRQLGGTVSLREDARLGMNSGHVSRTL